MPTNKKIGNDFEREFCEMLYKEGFWVHLLCQNQAGQPADVIAVKNGKAHLIDCKVCTGNKFVLSRVEENQHFAMDLWCERGNGFGLFAIKMEDKIYMVDSHVLKYFSKKQRSLNEREIFNVGKTFDEWVKLCE
jgi:Holliday junction resolvase